MGTSTAYVGDSAATRPSSQISLGRLVYTTVLTVLCKKMLQFDIHHIAVCHLQLELFAVKTVQFLAHPVYA